MPDFYEISNTIRQDLTTLNQKISLLQSIKSQLKRKTNERDQEELNRKFMEVHSSSKELMLVIQKRARSLANINVTGEEKIQKDRLANEIILAARNFQKIVETEIRETSGRRFDASNEKPLVYIENENAYKYNRSEDEWDQTRQKQMQSNQEFEQVKGRQNQLQNLEQDIVDLNSVFKDLALIVHEQGDIIDNIASNIEETEQTVISASQQLKEASTYQSKARRKKCCILLIVFLILIIIAVIVVVSIHPWK